MAARSVVVADGEIAAYHCIARCVRRAALCGQDPLTQRSFDHRKHWLEQRLETLASGFAIDIGSYAIMSNHLHLAVKTRPDLADRWDAREITRRWRIIFPMLSKPPRVRKAIIATEINDKKLVASRRKRLSNVSWFMRTLLEPIARRANREDQCTGRFWEERFKCIALLDDTAILACSTYIDLNPIRAGICKTPEDSQFTSIFTRLSDRQHRQAGWLASMVRENEKGKESRRPTITPWIDLSFAEYLMLVDWTGRQIREGKKGAIPADLAPILDRLKIRAESWMLFAPQFGELFTRWAGRPEMLEARARQKGRTRIHGLATSRKLFE